MTELGMWGGVVSVALEGRMAPLPTTRTMEAGRWHPRQLVKSWHVVIDGKFTTRAEQRGTWLPVSASRGSVLPSNEYVYQLFPGHAGYRVGGERAVERTHRLR